MRYIYLAFTIIILSLMPKLVLAQNAADAAATADKRMPGSLAIVEDEDANAFRFMIDGEEVARIDATGLHVKKGLNYGSVLTDYGPEGFDSHISGTGADNAK